jgi:hypothetical protein
MMKGYVYLMLSALLGVFVLLQTGCAWHGSGYSRYPYSYDSYYWYPYSYDGYYGYPYRSYYRWPYRSYHYRDYRYRYKPRERYDDDHRIGRPRPPQSRPPERRPLLQPNRPKDGGRSPLDKPFLRDDRPKRR